MNQNRKLNPELIELLKLEYSLSDLAYEIIRDAIISGSFFPGEQLKQLDLADEVGVSQRTVREALKRLAAIGLIDQQAYKGFYVLKVPAAEQERVFRLKANLEEFAIPEIMQSFSAEDLQRMEALLPQTISNDSSIPVAVVRKANREFHMIPIEATQNTHLIRILGQLWDISMSYYKEEKLSAEQRKLSWQRDVDEHGEMLEALRNKDAEALKVVFQRHRDSNINALHERKW